MDRSEANGSQLSGGDTSSCSCDHCYDSNDCQGEIFMGGEKMGVNFLFVNGKL